jgi:hypothetical protein
MADETIESGAEVKSAECGQVDQRRAWERPTLSRLSARKAEVGLLLGPEVLVLLRS